MTIQRGGIYGSSFEFPHQHSVTANQGTSWQSKVLAVDRYKLTLPTTLDMVLLLLFTFILYNNTPQYNADNEYC